MPDARAKLNPKKGAAVARRANPTNYDSIGHSEVHQKPHGDHHHHHQVDMAHETDMTKSEGPRQRRSLVAHSMLVQQDVVELETAPPAVTSSVQTAIKASLFINVFITIGNLYAALTSGSLAVLSSLVDSILDLTSQALFWYADKHMHTPDENYPAGRRRLEPIAVVVSATLMGMAAIEVVQKSIETLVDGFDGAIPDLAMTPLTVGILLSAITIKLGLWWVCARIAKTSPSADALAQDHRNDILSNSLAVTSSLIAHYDRSLWYLDSFGAIAISLYIGYSWLATGNEQVERLIGLRTIAGADPEFIDHVRNLVDLHHPLMKLDVVRAYHFGNHYLVELEVVLPETMNVREAHDIVIELQQKVEALDSVERAFVHVDYQARDYDEHKDPTVRRDSTDPPSPRKTSV